MIILAGDLSKIDEQAKQEEKEDPDSSSESEAARDLRYLKTLPSRAPAQKRPLAQTFFERQYDSKILHSRKKRNMESQKKRQNFEKKHRSFDQGFHRVEGLRKLLIMKDGNVVRGWRKRLDTAGYGKIGHAQLCKQVRLLGYNSCLNGLWKDMKGEEKGFITFDAIAPETAQFLDNFSKELALKFQTCENAWKVFAGDDMEAKLPYDKFKAVLKKNGISGEEFRPKEIFKVLDYDGNGSIIYPEFAYIRTRGHFQNHISKCQTAIHREKIQREILLGPLKEKPKPLGHDIDPTLSICVSQDLLALEQPEDPVDYFNKFILKQFGNKARAWLRGIATQGELYVPFPTFCSRIKDFGYTMSPSFLWEKLVKEKGKGCSLKDIDPEMWELIQKMMKTAKLRGDRKLWSILDVEGKNHVTKDEFLKVAPGIGFTPEEASRLFDIMDIDGLNVLSRPDISRLFPNFYKNPSDKNYKTSITCKIIKNNINLRNGKWRLLRENNAISQSQPHTRVASPSPNKLLPLSNPWKRDYIPGVNARLDSNPMVIANARNKTPVLPVFVMPANYGRPKSINDNKNLKGSKSLKNFRPHSVHF